MRIGLEDSRSGYEETSQAIQKSRLGEMNAYTRVMRDRLKRVGAFKTDLGIEV